MQVLACGNDEPGDGEHTNLSEHALHTNAAFCHTTIKCDDKLKFRIVHPIIRAKPKSAPPHPKCVQHGPEVIEQWDQHKQDPAPDQGGQGSPHHCEPQEIERGH